MDEPVIERPRFADAYAASIVFLDFDGVLHPDGGRERFSRLPAFSDWLRSRPQVYVVISSTWRALHPWNELVGLFDADIQPRVVGATQLYSKIDPEPEPRWLLYKREAECRHWIMSNALATQPWAALDDMPSLFSPFCPQLVVCDSKVGFAEDQAAELDRRLFAGR
jgi:hypothetical protein